MTNNEPLAIRGPNDHFHVRINDAWHFNQTREEAWSLLWQADVNPSPILYDAKWPPRMLSSIEYRRVGRHRWWVDGLPLPEKVVRYILRDECGCNKEQCDLIIEAHKLCDQCRKLRERIEEETLQELRKECAKWLLSGKSGLGPKGRMSHESTEPSSVNTNTAEETPRAKRQSRTRST